MGAEIVSRKTYKNNRNPILPPNCHIPDGEAHIMSDGRLYIYGSYDDLEDIYSSEEYHVVSTADLEHWTIYDTALRGQQAYWFRNPKYPRCQVGGDLDHPTPFMRKILTDKKKKGKDREELREERPLLYAPDCAEKDGNYYLYFCMPDDSEGVAIADRPEGPFSNPVQLPCGGIDPAVLVDDDGQAYYYWGQFSSCGVKLNPDMQSFDTNKIVKGLVTEEKHFFHEGSSMRKIGNTYYYIYADMERGKPTALGYATSESPLGPFTYRGIIIDNAGCDPECWNNHGSIECVNGQWYVFYHRSSRGSRLHRRLCIEPIVINQDGSIDEVRMTSQGAGKPFAPGEVIEGWRACELKGTVYIGLDERYDEKLTNISDKDSAVFRYICSELGFSGIEVKTFGTGSIIILLDGKTVGKLIVGENGKNVFETVQVNRTKLNVPAGQYELRLCFEKPDCLEIIEITML